MYIEFNLIKVYTKYKIVPFCPYYFAHTILSVPFCPLPFCPVTAEVRYRIIIGSRAFHISAPREWNRLLLYIRSQNSLLSFKKRLKTHYMFLHGVQGKGIGKLMGSSPGG